MPADLGYKPRPWQDECHRNMKRFTVLALHRRAGKTQMALMELIDKALHSRAELPFYVYLAPFLKQSKAIAWLRLKQILGPMRLVNAVDVNEADLSITFKHNGAQIRLFGGDNPDALRGVRLDGCVIDEVAQIRPEVWNDIIQPALSDRKGWAVFMGTPRGKNEFWEIVEEAKKDDNEQVYTFILIALALGYAIGGALADRFQRARFLAHLRVLRANNQWLSLWN